MVFFRVSTGLFLLLLLASCPGAQGENGCKIAVKRLVETYRGLKTLRAHFVQTLDAPALKQKEREEGELFLASGGKMRWNYSSPPGKMAWVDGQKCNVYLPEDRQVISRPLSDAGVARLLMDFAAFENEVHCSSVKDLSDGFCELELKVAAGGGGDLPVTAHVDRKTGLITHLSYLDPIGNTITYTFTDMSANVSLKADCFKVSLPCGTRFTSGI